MIPKSENDVRITLKAYSSEPHRLACGSSQISGASVGTYSWNLDEEGSLAELITISDVDVQQIININTL